MPSRKAAWASWNVAKGDDDKVCVTYWMNRLQHLQKIETCIRHPEPGQRPCVR